MLVAVGKDDEMIYTDGLNERQKTAVIDTEGAMLILAGAGSGKTKVVTNKIAYLIDEKAVHPGNILAITFTNKAANEMKKRVGHLLEGSIDKLWIGTFHSVCVRMLRGDIDKLGYNRNFTIYDRDDQLTVAREAVKELNLDKSLFKESEVVSTVSRLKSKGISPDMYINANYNILRQRKMGELYQYYEQKLISNNALDFDDLLLKTVELLKKEPDILRHYQSKFRYIFVDEYQDTNSLQYQLVKMLSTGHGNICVVGDGDQSIYGWRGADISNILNFEKDFKDAKVILLEQNYRSTSKILNVANEVIQNNEERKDKRLWTSNEEGDNVEYHELADNEEEAEFVLNRILDLKLEGRKNSDFAVLYRTNVQSRSFEESFMKCGLRYKIVGGLKFYDRMEIKDIIAYLKVMVNPKDDVALRRIINTPKRGIGSSTVDKLAAFAIREGYSMMDALSDPAFMEEMSGRQQKLLSDFQYLIRRLSDFAIDASVKEVVDYLIEETRYAEELIKENTVEAKSRLENVREFSSVALNFEMMIESSDLTDFLAQISLLSDVDKTEEGDDCVTLMTMHSAKGLEFPVVFVVGMEDGLFPSMRSIEDGNLEEERRLCYVAVTRAEQKLYLTSANLRTIYGQNNYTKKSRFIDEMGSTVERKKSAFSERLATNCSSSKKAVSSGVTVKYIDESGYENQYQKSKYEERYFFAKTSVRPSNTEKPIKNFMVGDKVKHSKFGIGTIVQMKEKAQGDKELVVAFDGGDLKRMLLSIAPLEKLE